MILHIYICIVFCVLYKNIVITEERAIQFEDRELEKLLRKLVVSEAPPNGVVEKDGRYGAKQATLGHRGLSEGVVWHLISCTRKALFSPKMNDNFIFEIKETCLTKKNP